MGGANSHEELAKQLRGICVVELISAATLPKSLENTSIYVRMRLTTSACAPRGPWVRSICRRNTRTPVWHSYRDLCCPADDGDRLEIELCAEERGGERIATNSVPVLLDASDPYDVWLHLTPQLGGGDVALTLRFVRAPLYQRKVLFFIRHGESRWNEAMRTKDVKEIITRVDHSLTREGIENAIDLHDMWHQHRPLHALFQEDSAAASFDGISTAQLEDEFVGADMVFSSPLTRAVQTAQLVLHDHPAVVRRGIVLLRAAREIKRALVSVSE